MLNGQFDIKRIHIFKELLFRLRHNESSETIQADFIQYFQNVSAVDILLIQLELINGDYGITSEDVKNFSGIYHHLCDKTMDKEVSYPAFHPDHPVQIFKEENTAFQVVLNQIKHLLESLTEDSQQFQKLNDLDEFTSVALK